MVAEKGAAHAKASLSVVATPDGHLACYAGGLEGSTNGGPLVAIDHAKASHAVEETGIGWIEQHGVGIYLRKMDVLCPQPRQPHRQHQ
jgi:hypothetical protein